MKSSLSRKVFEGALYAALLAVGLAFLPVVNLQFDLVKVVIFRACVLIMGVGVVWRVLCEDEWSLPAWAKRWQFRLLVGGAVVAFLTGTVFSTMPALSFWGSYFRLDGGLSYLYYAAFFGLIVVGVDERQVFEKGLKVLGTSFAVVAFYGLLQWLGLDPFGFDLQATSLGRVFSTLGHPNYLASYIILVCFPVMGWLMAKGDKRLALGLIVTSVALMILTGSRAGILGMGAGVFLFSFLIVKNKVWKKVILVGALLALVVSIVAFLRTDSRSINYRLEMWKGTVEMIQKKPVFGYGLETFGPQFQRYVSPEMVKYEETNVLADKPHNLILEILVEGGIFALLVWIWGVWLVAKMARKDLESAGILSALGGIFVAHQFGFSTVAHMVISLFLMGYLCFLAGGKRVTKKIFRMDKLMKGLVMTFIVGAAFFALTFHSTFPLAADYFAEKGLNALDNANANETLSNLINAATLNPNQSFYNYVLAQAFEQVEDKAKMDFYLQKAGEFTNFADGYYYFIKKDFTKAVELYPNYPALRLSYGIDEAKKGDCEGAIRDLEKYMNLVKNRFKSTDSEVRRLFEKHNPEFNLGLKYLANCRIDIGK